MNFDGLTIIIFLCFLLAIYTGYRHFLYIPMKSFMPDLFEKAWAEYENLACLDFDHLSPDVRKWVMDQLDGLEISIDMVETSRIRRTNSKKDIQSWVLRFEGVLLEVVQKIDKVKKVIDKGYLDPLEPIYVKG